MSGTSTFCDAKANKAMGIKVSTTIIIVIFCIFKYRPRLWIEILLVAFELAHPLVVQINLNVNIQKWTLIYKAFY